ncbi:MAG: acyltransferase [Armatimonadetes bacterium]|nr:acyltransferase [Armatimonadota bacterium]
MSQEELRAELLSLLREDPTLLDHLLADRYLRNPFPPSAAGPRLVVDPSATISPLAHVELQGDDTRIEVGPRSLVNHFAWLRAWGEGIRIGADCSVQQHCMIQGPITLGDGVRIGAHTLFIATEHRFGRTDQPIFRQGVAWRGITVGSDVYVGSHVTVLDGVKIGDGCVIGAGAVVNRDIPPFSIAAGVPARVVGRRGEGE